MVVKFKVVALNLKSWGVLPLQDSLLVTSWGVQTSRHHKDHRLWLQYLITSHFQQTFSE